VLPHLVPHFRLLTLGAPLLVSATNEAVRYRTRKHFALLIRLALEPGRKFARDYLIDLLWPDVPSDRGRHSLSQAITMLRHTLGPAGLAAHRATVALNEDLVEVDALRLESGEVTVRGRFLDGFELRGARGFDEWREAWAARLYPQIRDCLVKQMDAGRRVGDFETVERHAHLLEELDPLSEDAVRGIMEARAWVGDRSNALKAFTRYAARISEELSAKASPELTRIADLLREGRRAAPRPTADGVRPREERRFESETIIGREREFSALYDAWIDVRNNRPRVMVVLGDPGIGKTTLTNAFVSSCQMEGGIIARAQAYDAERELPYAVLAELVRQLTTQRSIGAAEPEALAELTRLCPDISTIFPGVPRPSEWPPEVVPLRLADAFTKAVTASADDIPVVLVVDDIHAADNASIAILHMLARKLTGLRVLMILTGRSGSLRRPSSAHALVTDGVIEGLGTVELDALSAESAAVLVARITARGVERWGDAPIEGIAHVGGGNPLALELLSREWVEEGSNSLTSQLDATRSLPPGMVSIPKAIRTMVERQTEQLDERTRAVLDLASMLGRRMGDLWLYQIIGCSETESLYHLTQLLDAHLLRDIAGNIEFRNELIRAHAYYGIPSIVRLELHRRIAGMLEYSHSNDQRKDLEIAWHYMVGQAVERAIPHALVGAEGSLHAGASREAEFILRQLMQQGIGSGPTRRVQLLLITALISQSRAEEALPLLEQLLADTSLSRLEMAQAARLYASGVYLFNKYSATRHGELASRAIEIARECKDSDLLSHALFEAGRAGVEGGDHLLTINTRTEIKQIIASEGWKAPPMAFHTDAFCNYYLSDIGDAVTSAQKAVAGFSRQGSIGELAQAYTGLGNCLLVSCELEEARAAYKLALDLSVKMGDDCRSSIVLSNICAAHFLEGNIDAALEYGQSSLTYGRRAPAQPSLMRTWANLASAHIARGEVDKAKECFDSWERWMKNGRSWSARMEYLCDTASMEFVLGNTGEALNLIATAELESKGREELVVNQGRFERLRVFLAYHVSGILAARELAEASTRRFRGRNHLAYFESLAALGWLETRTGGTDSASTQELLRLLEHHGLRGKVALLRMEGFLA
jgi:DNA-binding SARP family transcriptional activator/tetratricopeptide (TPR) repeat protein